MHAVEVVFGERIAEVDVRRGLALHHHVGPAHGIGLRIQLLAEDVKRRLRIEVA